MKNTENEKQKYSWFACLFFTLFGFVFLIGFIAESYYLYTGGRLFIAWAASGFLAYVFLYTAYKGNSPKWINDADIFSSNKDVDKLN